MLRGGYKPVTRQVMIKYYIDKQIFYLEIELPDIVDILTLANIDEKP